MSKIRFCSMVAIIALLALPTLGLAAPAVADPAGIEAATASGAGMLGISFEQLIALIGTVLVPLLLGLGTLIWKAGAAEKEAKIAQWIRAAYMITEEVSKLTPNTVDDKIAYALKVLSERLTAAGITPTAAIGEQARATWTAMSGAEKVEASVRAKAVVMANQKQAAAAAAESAARPQTPPAA